MKGETLDRCATCGCVAEYLWRIGQRGLEHSVACENARCFAKTGWFTTQVRAMVVWNQKQREDAK
jgi:hypothetical protein